MLSYQHAFHAGNRADMIKHAILFTVLSDPQFVRNRTLYIETHAGRGHYDLASKEASKTGEHLSGISALIDDTSAVTPACLRPFARFIGDYRDEFGPQAYPGSPSFAARMLNGKSRIILFERHPQEYAALASTLGEDERAVLHKSDGYLGTLRLQPRRGEKMTLLIDPSYETENDILNVGNWVPRALAKWPDAIILVWLPLFADARETELLEHLAGFEPTAIIGTRWPTKPDDNKALAGSAMALFGVSEDVSTRAETVSDAFHDRWWAT